MSGHADGYDRAFSRCVLGDRSSVVISDGYCSLIANADYTRESEGVCFYRRWFGYLSATTITKKLVDGFVPNFIGRFLGEKGRPMFAFRYYRYRGTWK